MRDGPPEVCFVRRFFWCGTDHLPEIDPAGLPFLGSPPNPQKSKNRNGNDQRAEKRMLIFRLNC